ncbi:hypothetical protein AB6G21_20790 [Providencia hangzhouensis]|uniref:hypothetical protein n=1 Tax=Providencia hangzhouensis TaxID=3031799 RepID=UPI0034DCD49F
MKWKYRFGAVAGNTLEYYDIAVFVAISSYLSAELERLGYNQADRDGMGYICFAFYYSACWCLYYREVCRQGW